VTTLEQAQQWQIGDVLITCVQEIVISVPPSVIVAELTAESIGDDARWLIPHYGTAAADGSLEVFVAIQSMCIEDAGRKIIVDTCFGDGKNLPYEGLPRMGRGYLDRLAAAGFERNTVDTVMCTHLHLDHVGWNTMRPQAGDGGSDDTAEWVPTFPNARYLFSATDLAHWLVHDGADVDLSESVQPILTAGLCDEVAMDATVSDHVRLVPTPGHTPGHCSVLIESGGHRALIGGDMFHHPIQVVHHEWPSVPDDDPVAAVATRARILPTVVQDGILLIGTHFAEPTAGHVGRDGDHYVWKPLETAR
jgi:glyoxylase-like metal-dependent hydrolase (beta-lactamase superfamily II)